MSPLNLEMGALPKRRTGCRTIVEYPPELPNRTPKLELALPGQPVENRATRSVVPGAMLGQVHQRITHGAQFLHAAL